MHKSAVQRAALLGLLLSPLDLAPGLAPQAPPGPPSEGAAAGPRTPAVPWNRRSVEHLLNRAGFGAREGDIQWALRLGPEAYVDELLHGGRPVPPPHYVQGTLEDLDRGNDLPRAQKRRVKAEQSRQDREQLASYAGWWLDRMVRHDEPLRDRMTLLWHGLFATEHRKVKRSYDVIEQHQLLRENAIENYGDLLRGIVVDPAMLAYLDNNRNKKGNPNENLARELLELFSLGEGNYTEDDVRQVARALTGHFRDRLGNYRFAPNQHDRGRKTILGETGRFEADGVVDVLLEQTACSRYVAGRILAYLEGTPPDELRLTEYAAHLKLHDYELRPFLRKLLLDPRFYREEVVGTRVAGPVDYLVGNVRRLGLDIDSEFLFLASGELGQRLFDPPSVQGWDEGEAWIHTGSLLARGNTTGLMLGTVDLGQTFAFQSPRDRAPSDRRGGAVPDARGAAPGRAMAEEAMQDRSMGGESMQGEAGMEGAAMEGDSMQGASMEGDSMQGAAMEGDSMQGASMEGAGMAGAAMAEARPKRPREKLPRELSRLLQGLGEDYQPRLNLSYPLRRRGLVGDELVVTALLEDLLAIEPPADTRERLVRWMRWQRESLRLTEEQFAASPDLAEPILRRIAHLILSLPEAQLG